MKEGTKVEIPLWLGEMLAVSQTSTNVSNVTLDLPDALSTKVLNALTADSKSVELRPLAPHFYSLGTRILELFEDEDLAEVLSDVCRSAIIALHHANHWLEFQEKSS
jgi:GINS complex subunit 3